MADRLLRMRVNGAGGGIVELDGVRVPCRAVTVYTRAGHPTRVELEFVGDEIDIEVEDPRIVSTEVVVVRECENAKALRTKIQRHFA